MSTIDQTELITTKYLIEPNPGYDFNNKLTDVYVVQNIAEDVNYTNISTSSTNRYQLNFQIDPGNVFMDRGVQLRVDLPLVFERITPATVTPTKENYADAFFDGYKSFAWKQFGFANAIQNIAITIDGFTYTVTDVPEMLKIVSRYYDEEIVHQRVPASLPDVMDYDNYSQTSKFVKTSPLNGSDDPLMIKPSIINSHNIFESLGNPDFNTRTPMVCFTDYKDEKLAGEIVSENCFIPFSIFGIRGLDVQPLIGVKSINLKITLKSSWEKHLFCTKDAFMKSVKFDESRLNKFVVDLGYKTYCPPQYIDQAHGLSQAVPDYNLKFQICELQNSVQTISFKASDIIKKIPVVTYKIKAIPKAIYVAATMKAPNDESLMSTPDLFARINDLAIEVAGKKTILPNYPTGIMEIAKSNGYQDSIEIGYYLGGYPLKINMTDDLGAKSNALVGSRNNIQNELRITNLTVSNVARYGEACDYDIRVVCIYDSMLAYRNGKFTLMDSLLETETGINIEAHVSTLYNHQIQKMNAIGGSMGSLFSAAIPTLKKIGKGVFNVVKRIATDKNFRGHLLDAYNDVKSTAMPSPNYVERSAAPARPANYVEQQGGYYSSHQPSGGFSNTMQGGRNVGQLRY